MKKIFTFMFVTLLAIGFASAIYNPNAELIEGEVMATKTSGQGTPEPMLLATGNGEGNGNIESTGEPRMRLQGEGEFTFQDGRTLQFSEEGKRIRLQIGEHVAECEDCNLSREDRNLKAMMSNGRNAEIKIMPDQANERAIERLRLRLCENCSIELKEVGRGNETRMAYEVKTKKEARLFGIFKTRMNVEAQIDAENGEIIRSRKPWWAFLASELEETEEIE